MNRTCDDCGKSLAGDAPLPPEETWLCGECQAKKTDAGDWYDRQAAKARRLSDELAREKSKQVRDGKLIKRLEHALEQARYVGD